MNIFYRFFIKLIMFSTLISMINIFFNNSCYLCLICSLCIMAYLFYELIDKLYGFDSWGDVSFSNDTFVVYGTNNSNNNTTYYNTKTYETSKKDIVNDIASSIKLNTNKIEIIETTQKEVVRPIKKVSPRLITKETKKETIVDDKITINPKEFNKDLIMLVNDEKLSENYCMIYNAIIGALKESKVYSTSQISNILQAFPYIDLVDNNVIIYVNDRQLEGVLLTKIKRIIITSLNEKFKNKMKISFGDMKYMSVFDYFTKNNEL